MSYSSSALGSFDPFIPHNQTQFKGPDRPKISSLKRRAHKIAVDLLPKFSEEVKGSQSHVTKKAKHHRKVDEREWLKEVHSLCTDILKCQNLGQKVKQPFLEDLSTIKRRVDLFESINAELVKSSLPSLVELVESDLLAVQRSLDVGDLDHFFFSSLHDAFEEQVEHWNALAEHPLYPNGECLQEHAYDSLIQYANLEKRLYDLEESEALSEKEKALLEEARQTLVPIRETFKTVVLPTIKEKLAESQKEYQNAAKAMDRSSTFRKRWSQDSAASLIEDFGRYQHALADLRYQESVMKSALAYLPSSWKASDLEEDVKELKQAIVWDAAISQKSLEKARQLFARRIIALTPQEKSAFKQLLLERLNGGDPSIVQETHALLRSMGEVIANNPAFGDVPPADRFFKELNMMARKEQKKSHPKETADQFYQRVMHQEYLKAVATFHAEWEKQEDKLIGELEKGPSLKKQRAMGLFFLTLQGMQGLSQDADLKNAMLTKPDRSYWGTSGSKGIEKELEEGELQAFSERYASPGPLVEREALKPAQILSQSNPNPRLQVHLTSALINGNLQDAINAVKAGADPNTKRPDGKTAFHVALQQKNANAVKTLLEQGIDVVSRDIEGNRLLDLARATDKEIARSTLRPSDQI